MLAANETRRPVGRPRIADGASWLAGLLADAPKPAADVIFAAEQRGISERTLTRIKGKLFRQLNAGQKGPWRAFQRDGHWIWGDERQMPKPPKRDSYGRPIHEDGSLIIDESIPASSSRELQQMDADWRAKHRQSAVVTAQPAVQQPDVPATPIWLDRELWPVFPVTSEQRLRELVSEINSVEGEQTADMEECLAALYSAIDGKQKSVEKP